MKYFFLFFLLMPMVSGMAVTPTKLDFGVVDNNPIRELKVFNNMEYGADYSICTNSKYCRSEPAKAYLESEESLTFNITILPEKKGNHSVSIYVEELQEGANIINSIAIPAKFVSNVEREILIEEPLGDLAIQGKAVAKIRPFGGRVYVYVIVLLVVLVVLAFFGRKFMKKSFKKLLLTLRNYKKRCNKHRNPNQEPKVEELPIP